MLSFTPETIQLVVSYAVREMYDLTIFSGSTYISNGVVLMLCGLNELSAVGKKRDYS